jgi:DNA-3-methyladenine glycosylase I
MEYHDNEWGVPLYDNQKLFELLCLEGAQAGLTWELILNRREAYRECFWNFDVVTILKHTPEQLLDRAKGFHVVQNKLKITGVLKNAVAYGKVLQDYSTFHEFLWSYVNYTPIVTVWKNYKDAPTQTETSKQLSKDLKKYGFTFVGPTICYAFMQAAGLVSDHEKGCFKVK